MDLPKILIIDDEPLLRLTLCDFFQDEGFEVFSASSAEDALEIVKEKEIDLCSVDIRLPRHDGNYFVLQANKINNKTKFMLHTGSMDYILPIELKEIGVKECDVLIKPVDLEEIYKKVMQLLGKL